MSDEKENKAQLAALEEISVMVAEMRQFSTRVMTGYESAHRTIADLCASMSTRAEKAEAIAVRSFEMQMRLAEEREELLSRKHKRELESAEAKASREMTDDLKREGVALTKLVVKRLAGIPLTAEGGSGLDDLLTSFSQEQFDRLMTDGTVQLTAAQRQVIIAVVQENAAKKTEKSEPVPEAAE